MSTPFVKYCPMCGTENPPISSFCERCDADLMSAPVQMRHETEPVLAPVTPSVEPVPEVEAVPADQNETHTRRIEPQRTGLTLELVEDPTLKFVVQDGQSVGRASKADVVLTGVPKLEYISRAHARFLQRREQWYVQYIAEGNSITVDGIESRDDSELAIYDGSIVVLSFTPFRVKIS